MLNSFVHASLGFNVCMPSKQGTALGSYHIRLIQAIGDLLRTLLKIVIFCHTEHPPNHEYTNTNLQTVQ